MRLGVSVVAFGSAAHLEALVDSLCRIDRRAGRGLWVALVDNGGESSALARRAAVLERHGIPTVLVTPGRNTGYSGGNVVGVEALRRRGCDTFWVLNPDTTVVDADLEALSRAVRPEAPLLGSTSLLDVDGVVRPGRGGLELLTTRTSPRLRGPGRATQRTYVAGHSLVVTATAWDLLGGFDTRYSLFCEDADLSARARRAGIPVLHLPQLTVEHTGGHATGSHVAVAEKSLLTFRHATASILRFHRSHVPALLPWAVLVRSTWALGLLARGRTAAAGAVVRGVLDGLLGRVPALPVRVVR